MRIVMIDGVPYVRAVEIPEWLEKTAVNAENAFCLQTARNLRSYACQLRKWILDTINRA